MARKDFWNATRPRQDSLFQKYVEHPELAGLQPVLYPGSSSSPSTLGLLGGDTAGFPNGRRVKDDVVTIEVRAVAGATIPLVDPSFTPDGVVNVVTQGVNPDRLGCAATRVLLGAQVDFLGEELLLARDRGVCIHKQNMMLDSVVLGRLPGQ
jgi:Domain of unknown function (DUF4331)